MILKKSNAFVLFREEFYIDSAESEVSDLDEAVLASPEQNDSHVCLMNNTARTAVYVFHVVMTFLPPPFLQDEMDLATVLKDFQETHLDTSNYCTIIARRRKILHSACMALSKSYFAWHKLPNIEFVGEMADDYGGPRREFFR